MAHIDKDTVRHIALLSRLELDDANVERFTRELGDILAYVDKLDELDTRDVPPMSHPIPMDNVFRPDAARPSLTVEDALANAPEKEDVFFKVPPIIQEN